jgi:hypothetical protein
MTTSVTEIKTCAELPPLEPLEPLGPLDLSDCSPGELQALLRTACGWLALARGAPRGLLAQVALEAKEEALREIRRRSEWFGCPAVYPDAVKPARSKNSN